MIEKLIEKNCEIINSSLEKYCKVMGHGLEKSMAYSLMSEGKRIRPFLTVETYKMFSKDKDLKKVIPFACAVEMVHTYSLIHDDLPAMDNDDYRRGKLTNHKVFGEAEAILAGDSLLTYAFALLANNSYVSDKSIVLATKWLSECAGFYGMTGGQMIDLNSSKTINPYDSLLAMHQLKTGMLIRAACLLGYFAACDTPDEKVVADLSAYSLRLGIAFQLRDDILDKISNDSVLGKPTGSDEKNDKTTSLSYLSIEEAQKEVDYYTQKAKSSINKYCKKDNSLSMLADYLINRNK